MVKLVNVSWNSTNKCNLRCKHCYAASGEAYENELSTEEVKHKIIDELAKLNCDFLSISGGEPFVREDIYELIKYAHDLGIKISMVSNGVYINEHTAKYLEEIGVKRIQISLESADENENDAIRGKGSFAHALSAIQELSKTKIYTAVAVTPMSLGIDLESLIQVALQNGADVVSIRRFVPMGRGINAIESEYSRKEFLEKVLYLQKKYRNKIKVTCADPILATVREDADSLASKHVLGGCSAGITTLAIDSLGNIKACTRLNKVLGNVRSSQLSEIWENSEELKYMRNRKNLSGKCGECKYKYICGGCRVSSYNNGDGLMGEDYECFL